MKLRILAVVVALAAGCQEKKPAGFFCPEGGDPAAYVDPMIGTSGSGNSVPGALLPHGMVKLSPDCVVDPGDVDSYEYQADRIEGFSHTHFQGPGGGVNGYSQILLMPTTGELKTEEIDYASAYSHDDEAAEPGYYMVMLQDYSVRAELTATAHAGFHRYTFPAADPARILVDVGHCRGDSRGGEIEIIDDFTVAGFGLYNVHPLLDLALSTERKTTGQSTIYFCAVFSRPFESYGTWTETAVNPGSAAETGPDIGAYLEFATAAGEAIEVRVGLSLVGVEQARKNLQAEIGEQSFEEIRAAARARWNCLLNRVQVEGGTADRKKVFYTALYHTLLAPADYTEEGGVFFSGADGKGYVYRNKDFRFYTDDWCAWDTFRTSRPLATLLEPETVDDVVASYLHLYRQGGWLPKCTWHATGYSRIMIGNHAVPMVADALIKGFSGFDRDTAWEALHKSATQDVDDDKFPGLCGYLNLGTPPEYIQSGYISHDCDMHQSASMTLEYAYNDWCTAQAAEALGQTDQVPIFEQRAKNYQNHWNEAVGFMQGRMLDGSWREPFDPADDADDNDFCEATSWIYTWFVPHDVEGLIELMGGAAAFAAKLDEFFAGDHFEISNEPSFHIPYLYNYAGRPGKTQEVVRTTLANDFGPDPGGLPGNDDSGATSAWYAFSAMGFFPVAPGDGVYQITSPLFDKTTILLNPAFAKGKTFVIETFDNSAQNLYIQSAELNGQPLERTWITHEEITKGGTLRLQMGSDPSTWGVQ
jgi:predicted alpha-1,2-mannosidase